MYERFTDRARKVMQLANQEAQRLNHDYIGTEHILLGFIKEGAGVAANVLKNLGVDLSNLRTEVQKFAHTAEGGALGRLPQTPAAKKVIDFAIEEALHLSHNYVGTEHLLLGLLRESDSAAAHVLRNHGLMLEKVREEVLNLLGHNLEMNEPNLLTTALSAPLVTPAVRGIMERAKEEARKLGNDYVGPEHVLLALCQADGESDSQLLKMLGLNYQHVFDLALSFRSHAKKSITEQPDDLFENHRSIAKVTAFIDRLINERIAAAVKRRKYKLALRLRNQADKKLLELGIHKAKIIEAMNNNPVIKDLQQIIADLTTQKEEAISNQDFDLAATIRDKTVPLVDRLNQLKKEFVAKSD
jgi:ATP-dependent Clp protease ATP-binding subunit ClpA